MAVIEGAEQIGKKLNRMVIASSPREERLASPKEVQDLEMTSFPSGKSVEGNSPLVRLGKLVILIVYKDSHA
jgi:hypothetical protein